MKKITALFFCLVFHFMNAQNDGWYQYSSPKKVNEIIKDSQGNYHCATDMGYVKLNSEKAVIDYRNLASHQIPLGNCNSVAVNPNDENIIAYSEEGRVTIVNGSSASVFSLSKNNLESFPTPQLYWSKNGTLYIYDKSTLYYQTIVNGVSNTKVDLSFKPQSIVENNDGTSVFFGGFNNGLWELDIATGIFTNYTEQNSDLAGNVIYDLYIDNQDILYIGSFKGLTTLENGTLTKYQQNIPNSLFFYPCFQLDVHPITGEVLVRSSEPNSSTQVGFCRVNLTDNTWTNYKKDEANCVNKNTFSSVIYSYDGSEILTFENFNGFTAPDHQAFNYSNNTCQNIDLNYYDAINLSSFSNMNVRAGNTPNTVDIGLINNDGFNILNISIDNFNGNYTNRTLPIPNPLGTFQYDIMTHKDFFIVTNNANSAQFVDINNNVTTHENFCSGSLIKAKKAGFSKTNNAPIIYCEFDDQYNRRLYMLDCDVSNGTCSESTEVFSDNRDLSASVTFRCQETSDTGLICGVVKENTNDIISVEVKEIDKTTKQETNVLDVEVAEHVTAIIKDLLFLDDSRNDGINNPKAHFLDSTNERLIKIEKENEQPKQTVYVNREDKNGDGFVSYLEEQDDSWVTDEVYDDASVFFRSIIGYFKLMDYARGEIALEYVRKRFSEYLAHEDGSIAGGKNLKSSNVDIQLPGYDIPGTAFENLPQDFTIYKLVNFGKDSGKYSIFMLTNYGLVFKQNIDYNITTLSNNQNVLFKDKITVYPNPATTYINVKGEGVKKLVLLDISGRMIKESMSSTIEANNLSKGIYLLSIHINNGETITKKIIKND